MYFQLCNRWRHYNRMIIIQPITEEILKNSKKKQLEKYNSQFNNNSSDNKGDNSASTCKSNVIIMNNSPADGSQPNSNG